jgi:hypothetical protein
VGYQLLSKLLLGKYLLWHGNWICIHLTSQIFSVNHSNSNWKGTLTTRKTVKSSKFIQQTHEYILIYSVGVHSFRLGNIFR